MAATTALPATEKQVAFATKLVNELCQVAGYGDNVKNPLMDALKGATKSQMSKVIDDLLTRVQAAKAQAAQSAKATRAAERAAGQRNAEDVDGMYKLGDQIVKVQYSRQTGRPYAKLLVSPCPEEWEFVYEPGLMAKVRRDGVKMTLDEAKQFGALYGTCCVCARTLTDEDSIAAGIGPICAKKF